jgi:hypothetical protein
MTVSTIKGSQIRLGAITAAHLAADAVYIANAFNYVSGIAGGATGSATDLALQSADGKRAGSYYKVTTAGYFKVSAPVVEPLDPDLQAEFYVNNNDGLVWNTGGTVDIIDNSNSTLTGTDHLIGVSGSTNLGYTVTIHSDFTTKVSNLESAVGTIGSLATTATDLVAAINEVHGELVAAAPVFVHETPAGDIDGANKAYLITDTSIAGTVQVYLNGVLQELTADYAFATKTITFVDAPVVDDKVSTIYYKLAA